MKTRVSLLSMAVIATLAIVACAEKKQLTEMHDSTEEMRDTTKELRDLTKNMNKTTTDMSADTQQVRQETQQVRGSTDKVLVETQEMRLLTSELYDASRQGAALALRRDLLESMQKAESSGKKVADAGKYFMAFEFQLWNDHGQDKLPEKRLELMTSATAEFFKDVKEFVVDGPARPFARAVPDHVWEIADNKSATFNAISAAMHRLNRKQEDVLKELAERKIQGVSIYTMIEDGLKVEKEVKEGRLEAEKLPQYQRDVIVNKDLAIQLLQSRMNFIAAIFVNETIDRKTWTGTWSAALNRYWHSGREWKLNLDTYSQPQIEQFSTYLKGSLKTKQLLIDIGVKPVVHPGIQSFFNGLNAQSEMKGTAKQVAALADLRNLILRMKDSKAAPPAAEPQTQPRPQQQAPVTVEKPQAPQMNPQAQTNPQPQVKPEIKDPNTTVPAPEAKTVPEKKPSLLQRLKNWWNKKPEQKTEQPAPAPQAPPAEDEQPE